jgi:hypothetical protein
MPEAPLLSSRIPLFLPAIVLLRIDDRVPATTTAGRLKIPRISADIAQTEETDGTTQARRPLSQAGRIANRV